MTHHSYQQELPLLNSLDSHLTESDNLFNAYLAEATLDRFECQYETWKIQETNAQLSYSSHGFFRFFGKFPPPVAKRFIEEFHDPTLGPVVDPMVGSGTTLVEAALMKRRAIGLDASPLSQLVAKVKTTPVPKQHVLGAVEAYNAFWDSEFLDDVSAYIPRDPYLDHWFYPETQQDIARTRFFIDQITSPEVRDIFRVALAANIRRYSRASNGLGRMFLDPALPRQDVREHLVRKIVQMATVCDALFAIQPQVQIHLHDAKVPFLSPEITNLAICHPPYFNLYKYSSIYKFEMLWLGLDRSDTRRRELREGFKIGKKELVATYVDDLVEVLSNVHRILVPGGWCLLMMGDTKLKGERIDTTALSLRRVIDSNIGFECERIIVRQPKFTEASYAATQRRTGADVGVRLQDHLVLLRKVSK